ncbi:MAG: site-specific DNA-methyltransferase [Promethearchaeota archaeon]|nr:MAG: site-specific DNA-methyltransferase [Candidatus Lokiarchaeota archaeon]
MHISKNAKRVVGAIVKLNWSINGKNKEDFFKKDTNVNYNLKLSEIIYPEIVDRFKQEGFLAESFINDFIENKKQTWINKLIQGDSLKVLESLLDIYEEKIDLIYIDPPFFSRKKHYYKIFIGDPKRSLKKLAYNDLWNKGLDSYLDFLYKRLYVMKKFLSPKGSIYVHLDHHASHYVKILLDELFGDENFRNEIIWHYPAASAQTKNFFVRSFDSIFFYSKGEDYIFNDNPHLYMDYSDRVTNALQKDEKGYFYYRGGSHNGKKLSRKVYIERKGVFPRDVWTEIPYIRANTMEYQGFSTQKPERLLKRIILASSNKDSIIADFFCGSGTSITVAEKLGRKWIGCDINWHSINIIKKRLLSLQNSNDILDWDKNYDKISRPFKIMYFDDIKKKQSIPSQFLKEGKHNPSKGALDRPKLEVKVNQKNNKIQVKIDNYNPSYTQMLREKVQNKFNSWKDYIDYISIDFDSPSNQFSPDWIDFRTPKKREITLNSGWYQPENKNSLNIEIKILDIFGSESNMIYKINL